MSRFGSYLAQLRTERNLTHAELAEGAELSERQVVRIEREEANPTQQTVLALANALGLSFELRNALLQASGFAAAYALDDMPSESRQKIELQVKDLVEGLNGTPAAAIGPGLKVLSMNTAFRTIVSRLFGDAHENGSRGHDTFLQDLMTNEVMAKRIANIAQLRRKIEARLTLQLDPSSVEPARSEGVELDDDAFSPGFDLSIFDGDSILSFRALVLSPGNHHDVTYRHVYLLVAMACDERTIRWLSEGSP